MRAKLESLQPCVSESIVMQQNYMRALIAGDRSYTLKRQ